MMRMNPMMQGAPMYQPSQEMAKQAAVVQEEIKEEQKTNGNVAEVTKNMVDVLSTSSNPKHRNSKFLKFLNKLNHGAYTIENE